VVELLLLLLLQSSKELDLAAHGNCACCTVHEDIAAASQKRWQFLSFSLLAIQEHPR
jgi:hypothetical protein